MGWPLLSSVPCQMPGYQDAPRHLSYLESLLGSTKWTREETGRPYEWHWHHQKCGAQWNGAAFHPLTGMILWRTGPRVRRSAQFQAVISALDALVNKWSHLHIFYKFLSYCLRVVSLVGVKNSVNRLSHKCPKYKSRLYICLHILRSQYMTLFGHCLSPLELQTLVTVTKTHILFRIHKTGLLEKALSKDIKVFSK